jgi:hypothetical protein
MSSTSFSVADMFCEALGVCMLSSTNEHVLCTMRQHCLPIRNQSTYFLITYHVGLPPAGRLRVAQRFSQMTHEAKPYSAPPTTYPPNTGENKFPKRVFACLYVLAVFSKCHRTEERRHRATTLTAVFTTPRKMPRPPGTADSPDVQPKTCSGQPVAPHRRTPVNSNFDPGATCWSTRGIPLAREPFQHRRFHRLQPRMICRSVIVID